MLKLTRKVIISIWPKSKETPSSKFKVNPEKVKISVWMRVVQGGLLPEFNSRGIVWTVSNKLLPLATNWLPLGRKKIFHITRKQLI